MLIDFHFPVKMLTFIGIEQYKCRSTKHILSSIRDLESAFEYIESFTNLEKSRHWPKGAYDLTRMNALVKELGYPYKSYTSVHVAGTKGKGSTAAFIASALTAHGYKTGLYTSPHVISYMERFSVNGTPMDEAVMIRSVERIKDAIGRMTASKAITAPTVFEILTLCAFLGFADCGCTHAVFEVGLGGRLDATNVIEPVASIITPIDLEHTDVLGTTIEEIAFEKSGIIKPRVPVFVGFQNKAAQMVIERQAASKRAPLLCIEDRIEGLETESSISGNRISISLRGRPALKATLSMIGDFQAENAGLALLAISRIFPEIGHESIAKGFSGTTLPGRMEICGKSPVVMLDGAHTPLACEKLAASFVRIFGERGILLFGALAGKNYAAMANILAPHFARIIISTPESTRESDPDAVYSVFSALRNDVFLEKRPFFAFEKALDFSKGEFPVLVTGSFYMVAAVKKILECGQ